MPMTFELSSNSNAFIVSVRRVVPSATTRRIESTMGSLLKMMQIPSKSDLARVERRLSALSRRVKAIEKARKSKGPSPT